ncbi:hypothetical protein [Winogradskyella sp.]
MEEKLGLLRYHFEELFALTDDEWNFVQSHFQYKSIKNISF